MVLLVVPASAQVAGASASARGASCHGERATIVGHGGHDRLTGTSHRDVIAGLGGNDRIDGLGGDDVICGGGDADRIAGGAGDDLLFGGLDLVEGGETPYHRGDWLTGGPGDDLLVGGVDDRASDPSAGDAVFWTDSAHAVGVDLTRGTATGQGHDRVRLPGGTFYLTSHPDTFLGTAASETVHALGGADEVRTGGGADTVWLDDVEEFSDDVVHSGPGDDTVWSLGGSDVVRTEGGRDALELVGHQFLVDARAGSGRDVVEVLLPVAPGHLISGGPAGDPARDLVRMEVVDDEPGDHSLDLATGVLLLGPDLLASQVGEFDDAELYQGRFTVLGTAGDNRLTVNLATVFHGLDGDDELAGSDQDDTFDGGPGDDSYLADGGGTNACLDVENDPQAVCAGA